MSVSADYLAYVIDQFAPFAKLVTRRMFGGVGLYVDGLFFGLISNDTLYLKVDDTNRDDYLSCSCAPFQPRPSNDAGAYSMSYFQVPEDVLEDPDVLGSWARKSLAVALMAAQVAAVAATAKARKKSPTAARTSAAKAAAARPRKSPRR